MLGTVDFRARMESAASKDLGVPSQMDVGSFGVTSDERVEERETKRDKRNVQTQDLEKKYLVPLLFLEEGLFEPGREVYRCGVRASQLIYSYHTLVSSLARTYYMCMPVKDTR